MECVKHAVGCFEWIVLRGGWGGIGGNLGRRGWFLDAHAAEIGGVCDGSDGWRRSTFAAECNELRGLGLLVLRRLGEECSWREEFCGKQEGISECWEVKESGNGIIYNGITQKHEVTPALMTTPIRSTF